MLQGHVLIINNDGTIENIVPEAEAGQGIQACDGIISPGFVNSHCHLELSHMKGIVPEHTGLIEFLLDIISKRNHGEDNILQAIENAENEMLQNGIVAVGDISNTTNTIAQKAKNNLLYYNFIEALGWNPDQAQQSFQRIALVYNDFKTKLKTQQTSIVPHAPYTVSNALWQLLQQGFVGNTISIHNQETPAENELFVHGTGGFLKLYNALSLDNTHFQPTGKTSLQSYIPSLSAAKNVILVHNSTTTQDDMLFAHANINQPEHQLYYCLCPNANLYIENTLPPVDHLIKNNCKIIIGTDSLASNHELNILSEIRTLHENFTEVPLQTLLQWATINGAEALQLQDTIGSFDTGKKPGVINIAADLSSVKRII